MVKIPNFNELKKMGEGLANSAKNTKIFDKIKTSVDSLGAGSAPDEVGHGEASTPLERCVKLVNQLQEVKRMEANLFNNLKAEIMQMAKVAESSGRAAKEEPVAQQSTQDEAKQEPPESEPTADDK